MATPEAEAQARNALKTTLDSLSNIRAEDLAREADLGKQLNFSAGIPAFRRLLGLYSDLSTGTLDNLPQSVLTQLQQQAQQALTFFQQVISFNPSQGNPAQARDNLIRQIQDAYDSQFPILEPHLAYSVRRDTDFAELERKARESVKATEKALADQKEALAKGLAEMETALKSVRDAAAEAGVAQHAINFQAESKEHKDEAQKWLRWTGLVGAFGVVLVLALFVWPFHPETSFTGATTPQAIYAVASRLLVFSIFYFALVWCGRNFMAHRHNYIVNKHRQNALATFRAFVAAAGDDKEVKNAVLLQASSSIFTAQPSGYFSKQAVQPPPTNLVEVIKSVHASAADD